MLNVDLSRNLASTPPPQLAGALENIFASLENQFSQMPNIIVLTSQNQKLPQGISSRDLVFNFTAGGELQVGVYNGSQIVYASFGTFTGTITDSQHGQRSGGNLHPDATNTTPGFLSIAFFALLTKLSGFASLQNSTTPPSVTQLPNDGNWGFIHDTVGGNYYLAYNFAGTVKSVQLT